MVSTQTSSDWTELNLSKLLPEPTKAALQGLGDIAKQVADVADWIASAIDALADIISKITDPLRVPIQLLIDRLKALLEDLLGTGIYFYYDGSSFPLYKTRAFSFEDIIRTMDIDGAETEHRERYESYREEVWRRGETIPPPYEPAALPFRPGQATGWNGWVQKWQESFYDQGDRQRPVFSDEAELTCILMIGGMPALDGLPELLKAIGILLGIKPFTQILDRMVITKLAQDAVAGQYEITVEKSTGFRDDDLVWIKTVGEEQDIKNDQFTSLRTVNQRLKTMKLYDPVKQAYPKGTIVMKTGTDPQCREASVAPDWHSRYYIGPMGTVTLDEDTGKYVFSNQPDGALKGVFIPDYDIGEYYIPFRLGDLPPVRAIGRVIKRVIGLLETVDGLLAMLQELAAALHEKAEQLRTVAEMIVKLIELIELIIEKTGGFILKLDSSTGVQGLFAALDEQGPPPLPAKSFVFGACLLAGTVDMGSVTDLFGV